MTRRSLFALLASTALAGAATAHGGKHFSAGAPGNPKQKAKTIEIVMREGDGKMSFSPDRLEVKRGEQVRFVLKNEGALPHEFMLATIKENVDHAKVMEKFPDMEHDDPNGKRLEPGKSVEMVWKFTKKGTFEFACLIPGHHAAGMRGTVIVK
jgi:uncharacterized cupredoxin-like copper-binding protein